LPPDAANVAREEVAGETNWHIVSQPDDLVLGVKSKSPKKISHLERRARENHRLVKGGDRSERLLLIDRAVGDVGEDRRLEEVALEPLASGDHLGTLGRGILDMPFGFVDGRALDEGAVRCASLKAIADLEFRDLVGKLLGKRVIDACCRNSFVSKGYGIDMMREREPAWT
jgi:hypothetical protein